MRDALRLAVGTLTVLPVRPPGRVDHVAAGWAMALASAVGAVLGLAAVVAALLLRQMFGPLLVAVVLVGLLGLSTRLIHWDGLADTADGLGSGRAAAGALEVMRRSDVGPFGVFALVFVSAVQVVALADLLARDALGAVVVATVLGRAALLPACRAGVPAARRDGLGSAVAGSVRPVQLAVGGAVAAATLLLTALLDPVLGWWEVLGAVVAGVVWAYAATAFLRRRLGGMTGDTLGALVETTTALALVVLVAG